MTNVYDRAESGGLPEYGSYARGGYADEFYNAKSTGKRKRGPSVLQLALLGIVALALAGGALYAVLARGKPGSGIVDGFKAHRGGARGAPHVKRIMQRHERRLKADGHEEMETVTKEMDLEHLEHAGFDPEAAAYEDGMDPEDLGYDESDDDMLHGAHWRDHESEHDNHDVLHNDLLPHAHGGGHSGSHVGNDSVLHGEDPLLQAGHHSDDHAGALGEHGGHGAHHATHDTKQHPHGGWKSTDDKANNQSDREHKIKVRKRLAEIFPHVDKNRDMHIDREEMLAWHEENGRNISARRAKREFTWADTNKDGRVTLAEYLAEIMPDSFKGNETMAEVDASPIWKDPAHDWVAANRDTFILADVDKDGSLNEAEHHAFQHPEDSDNAALHAHMRKQDVLDRDRNHNGRLEFEEFKDQMYYHITEWEHPEQDPPEDVDEMKARARFNQLDVNKDGALSADELHPVFYALHPRERDYARLQALHQIEAADNSGDGRLTLNEMLSNPYVFYGHTVIDEDEYDETVHDEF